MCAGIRGIFTYLMLYTRLTVVNRSVVSDSGGGSVL
jgi:hypothetical protein